MKIAFISDTHGKHWAVEVPECDIIIHSGDFSSIGTKDQIEDFLVWAKFQKCKRFIFIAGNHDKMAERDPGLFKTVLKSREVNSDPDGKIFYLQDELIQIDGLSIYGSPWTPSFFPDYWVFNADRGDKIKEKWDKIPENLDVLITHGPPFGILDTISTEKGSFGCSDLLTKVEETKPKIHVFGHLHKGGGSSMVGESTKFINAALLDDDYRLVREPIIFKI